MALCFFIAGLLMLAAGPVLVERTGSMLYISCSPVQARLRLSNRFADSQALVERIIDAGNKLRL